MPQRLRPASPPLWRRGQARKKRCREGGLHNRKALAGQRAAVYNKEWHEGVVTLAQCLVPAVPAVRGLFPLALVS